MARAAPRKGALVLADLRLDLSPGLYALARACAHCLTPMGRGPTLGRRRPGPANGASDFGWSSAAARPSSVAREFPPQVVEPLDAISPLQPVSLEQVDHRGERSAVATCRQYALSMSRVAAVAKNRGSLETTAFQIVASSGRAVAPACLPNSPDRQVTVTISARAVAFNRPPKRSRYGLAKEHPAPVPEGESLGISTLPPGLSRPPREK